MKEIEQAPTAAEGRRKLWTVAVVLYGTLALLLVAVPDGASSRLDDFEQTRLVRAAQATVAAVTHVSDALGVSTFFRAARARFLAAAGLERI